MGFQDRKIGTMKIQAFLCAALLVALGGLANETPISISPPEKPEQKEAPQVKARLAEATGFIRADVARSTYSVDGTGLTVAVFDTGLRTTHNDFGGKVLAQVNYTSDNGANANDATDGHGHGTNVAGIICANSIHTGIAPGAKIVPVKVLANNGSGTFADVESGLQWVINNKDTYNISVVNMSLGDGQNYASPFNTTLRTHIQTLRNANVAVVIAAGNDFFSHGSAQGMGYPGITPECVSVGALYDASAGGFSYGSGAQAFTSGPGRITPFSQRLHTSAGGANRTDIFGTGAPMTSSGISSDSGVSVMHGTSQAAPTIAGVILLMQEYYKRENGSLPSINLIENSLRNGGVTITDGDDEDDNVTNTGLDFIRVDVVTAIQALANGGTMPSAPTISAQPSDKSVKEGQTATFEVSASGTGLVYSWQKNGQTLSGATSSTYTTAATTTSDHGVTYRCVVSNGSGSVPSNSATLSVQANQAPTISSGPTASPASPVAGDSVSFSVNASDPDGDSLSYSWSFGDDGSGSGSSASHTYSSAGTFTVSVTVSDGKSSTSKEISLSVAHPNQPPSFTSSPQVSHNPGFAGDTFTFTVSASDPESDGLAYTWTFGDSSSGSGTSVDHVFTEAGSYTVEVTVSDGSNSIAEALIVNVQNARSIQVSSMNLKVNFKAPGRDMVRVKGQIELPDDVNLDGATIQLNIGGVVQNFTFSGNSRTSTAQGLFALKTTSGEFSVVMNRGDFTGDWAEHGIGNETVHNLTVTMPIQLTINGSIYKDQFNLVYSAKEDQAGKAR